MTGVLILTLQGWCAGHSLGSRCSTGSLCTCTHGFTTLSGVVGGDIGLGRSVDGNCAKDPAGIVSTSAERPVEHLVHFMLSKDISDFQSHQVTFGPLDVTPSHCTMSSISCYVLQQSSSSVNYPQYETSTVPSTMFGRTWKPLQFTHSPVHYPVYYFLYLSNLCLSL